MDVLIKYNSLEVIHDQVVFDSKDYSISKKDIVLYGIVVGWDNDSYREFLQKGDLTIKEIERLRQLNKQFSYLMKKAS